VQNSSRRNHHYEVAESNIREGVGVSVFRYNALLHHRLRVPVYSIVLLLHPRARHPNLNGVVQYGGPAERGGTDFRYKVVNLWERPAEELLLWPPSLLPLATLGELPAGVQQQDALAGIVRQILARLHGEVDQIRLRRLATAAYVLTGMKVEPDIAKSMFLGVQGMQDSSTYQAILDEGREEGYIKQGQKTLLLLGRIRFGEPDEATRQRVAAIKSLDQLDRLSERLLHVGSWKELLAN
jgi:predicted transposase YdaD